MYAWLQRMRRVSTVLRQDRYVRKVPWRTAQKGCSPCIQSLPLHEGPLWWCSQSTYQTTKWGDFHSSSLPFKHEVWTTLLFLVWASLVAQTVKNPPAMWETWVWSLGWEDPLEEDMAIHTSILAWGIPMNREAWWATVHGFVKSQTWLID